MTHQKVSILCVVHFGRFTSVVVSTAFDSGTSARAFVMATRMVRPWFSVLRVPYDAKVFDRNCMLLFCKVPGCIQEEMKPSKLI